MIVSPGQSGAGPEIRDGKRFVTEEYSIRCVVDRRTLAAYINLAIASAPFGRTIVGHKIPNKIGDIWLLDDGGFLPDWGHLELSYR